MLEEEENAYLSETVFTGKMGRTQETESITVHRIEYSVDWPPGHVASYLVDCAEPILFDAGMEGERGREELETGLSEHGYGLSDIDHLVITHPHVDHVGQVPAVLAANDPTVYAPSGVETRYQRDPDELADTVRKNAALAGLRGEYLDEAVEMSVRSLERDSSLLPSNAVDHWLVGGRTVDIGPLTFETIHTPGHQADHLCFLTDLGDERVIFSGDMALSTFRPVAMHTGFDDGYEEAIDAYYTALDRLGETTADRVYTGHDPVHTDYHGAIVDDRESLDRLLERTKDTLDTDQSKTAVDVAFERSGERDIRYLVIETASAMAKLEADGAVVGETDENGARQYRLAE